MKSERKPTTAEEEFELAKARHTATQAQESGRSPFLRLLERGEQLRHGEFAPASAYRRYLEDVEQFPFSDMPLRLETQAALTDAGIANFQQFQEMEAGTRPTLKPLSPETRDEVYKTITGMVFEEHHQQSEGQGEQKELQDAPHLVI